ncbi:Suppressor of Sensor Kinase (SLN1), partial [Kickxella alabastrina]
MRKLDDSPVSFSQRLFYLYGYSTEPESENSKHGIHSADAHGEELRRRNKARRTLEVALNEAGAQATTDADKGTAADYVVITDECSPEQREKALALGLPVINESVVLEKIQQPSALIISGEPDASVFAAVVASNNRLRPSVSLEGMAIRKLHAADASKAAVRRRPRGSVSSASSSSSELGHGPLAGPSGSGLGDDEYRERQEWRDMLASALTGEVVDNEKKRLISQGDSTPMMAGIGQTGDMSELVQNVDFQSMLRKMHVDMWLGCRAAIRGRTPQQEKQTLESLRAVHVDTTLRAVLDYSAAA